MGGPEIIRSAKRGRTDLHEVDRSAGRIFPEERQPLSPERVLALLDSPELGDAIRALALSIQQLRGDVALYTGQRLEPFEFETASVPGNATQDFRGVDFGSDDRDIRVSRATLWEIIVTSLAADPSTNYALEVYEDDTFQLRDRVARIEGINVHQRTRFIGGTSFMNQRDQGQIHFRIIESAGKSGPYLIKLRYVPGVLQR